MGRPAGSVNVRYAGMNLADRIRSRVTVEHASDLVDTPCWLWPGAVTQGSSGGYGTVKPVGDSAASPVYVHIVMYEDAQGPVPDGLEVDHLCAVVRCCNPGHLEAVTHAENMQRHFARSRWREARAA